MLIVKGAANSYINKKSNDDEGSMKKDDEDFDPFKKPKDPRKVGKYTPLHWASYKGYYQIVCKFLKIGFSPLDIDQYGNTAVH
jgi:hypothetical protein